MKRYPALKRALVVMAIVSVSLIVAFAALLVSYPYVLAAKTLGGGDSSEYVSMFFKNAFAVLGGAFVFPFNKEAESAMAFSSVYLSTGSESLPLVMSIVGFVFAGLVVIGLVLGIILVCMKGKAKYAVYSLPYILGAFASFVILELGATFLSTAKSAFEFGGEFVGLGIMAIAVFAVGILVFLTVVATYILGIIYACKASKARAEEVEEAAPSVAEAVGDPEAVQEGEELSAPVEPMVVESEPEPVVEEVEEPAPVEEEEPAPVEEEPKVEPEPKDEQHHVEVNVNNNNGNPQSGNGMDQASLASLLREVVRDIVRDEIARSSLNQPAQPAQPAPNGNQTITGATFGGPLVVQYFNGGINGVNPPCPSVVECPKKEPVEEKKEEPAPAPAPVEENKEEPKAEEAPRPLFVKKEEKKEEPAPAPVVEAAPAPEKKEYERITFAERLLRSDKELHALYNELKNEILSYGVKSRISSVGDTFRLHKKMYVRITVAGKSLKLYFALNPADYANSTIPVQDASNKEMYAEIPLVFKVKSPLSVRRCKELIQAVMEKDNLEQGEVGKVNWIKELKAEMASNKKEKE